MIMPASAQPGSASRCLYFRFTSSPPKERKAGRAIATPRRRYVEGEGSDEDITLASHLPFRVTWPWRVRVYLFYGPLFRVVPEAAWPNRVIEHCGRRARRRTCEDPR